MYYIDMNISRTHILMLAIISIFTGIIAPSVASESIFVPYAMTNMQYISYVILFVSGFLFVFSAFRFKKISIFLASTLILLIVSLSIMTIIWLVKDFSWIILQNFSWWWIFLTIGLFLLIFAFIKEEDEDFGEFSSFFEKIIGIVGFLILAILTAFVIFVAESNYAKSNKISSNFDNFFEQNQISNFQNSIISPGFDKIENFSFSRSNNFLSFVTTKNNQKIFYPWKIDISNSGNIIETTNFNWKNYILYENWEIFEKNNFVGKSLKNSIKDFILAENENNSKILIAENNEKIIENLDKNSEIFYYNKNNSSLYYRQKTPNWYAIFKNWEKISDEYFGILRFLVSENENLTLVIENENNEKFITKNDTIIHKINSNYINWSLQINESNSIYKIKNEDSSYWLVVNWVILDRKLDEIREIFLEKNSSGYSFFGKPQGEKYYCFFTRYKGNLCGLSGYMNPEFEADGSGVIFAGLRNWKWSIYRNITEFIKDLNYTKNNNFYSDYFFFDTTNPRYFLIVSKDNEKYTFNKMWKILEKNFLDFDIESVNFDYNGKILALAQDLDEKWKIIEIQ